jgi:CRISPR system Cascade subunit CasB
MTTPAAPVSENPLVENLVRLQENRGAMAALRRGLGKPAGTISEMFPYVEPLIPRNAHVRNVDAAYLVASLFGLHKNHSAPSGDVGSRQARGFGASLAAIRLREAATDEDEGVTRRFGALLNCDRDGLPTHLRQLMTLLHSRAPDVLVDYGQLYSDITQWEAVDRYVQRNWAAGFWRRVPAAGEAASDNDTDNTNKDQED